MDLVGEGQDGEESLAITGAEAGNSPLELEPGTEHAPDGDLGVPWGQPAGCADSLGGGIDLPVAVGVGEHGTKEGAQPALPFFGIGEDEFIDRIMQKDLLYGVKSRSQEVER